MTDGSRPLYEISEECKRFRGRDIDLCMGEGLDGRPRPSRKDSNRFRADNNLDPLPRRNAVAEIEDDGEDDYPTPIITPHWPHPQPETLYVDVHIVRSAVAGGCLNETLTLNHVETSVDGVPLWAGNDNSGAGWRLTCNAAGWKLDGDRLATPMTFTVGMADPLYLAGASTIKMPEPPWLPVMCIVLW